MDNSARMLRRGFRLPRRRSCTRCESLGKRVAVTSPWRVEVASCIFAMAEAVEASGSASLLHASAVDTHCYPRVLDIVTGSGEKLCGTHAKYTIYIERRAK